MRSCDNPIVSKVFLRSKVFIIVFIINKFITSIYDCVSCLLLIKARKREKRIIDKERMYCIFESILR